MARESKYVTILLVPDGAEPRSGWRVRQWLLKATVISLGLLLLGIVLFIIFYGQILARAATTERVQEENRELKRYYYKVQLLEQNMYQAREVVERMTALAGIDFEFPELPDDSTLFAELEGSGDATIARPTTLDWSLPAGLPIQGFVTQKYLVSEPDKYHPGVDIACAVGTPVLATGSGVVEYIAVDSIYGNLVVLKHNDSVTTVYGHNSKILVQEGQQVRVGSRIAESGNSGVSTAPHLHYEIRIHGEPIDPLDNPYDEKI